MNDLRPVRHAMVPVVAACCVMLFDLHPVVGVQGLDVEHSCLAGDQDVACLQAICAATEWILHDVPADPADRAEARELLDAVQLFVSSHDGLDHDGMDRLTRVLNLYLAGSKHMSHMVDHMVSLLKETSPVTGRGILADGLVS